MHYFRYFGSIWKLTVFAILDCFYIEKTNQRKQSSFQMLPKQSSVIAVHSHWAPGSILNPNTCLLSTSDVVAGFKAGRRVRHGELRTRRVSGTTSRGGKHTRAYDMHHVSNDTRCEQRQRMGRFECSRCIGVYDLGCRVLCEGLLGFFGCGDRVCELR